MATLTKVSPYRMGPPRFGTKPYVFDNSVKTYQLTPEQLERLKNGESIDDILKNCESVKEEKNMANKKIDLTVEEYVEMHKKGMSDAEIAQEKGITNQQLYSWKYFRKGHIKRFLEQSEAEQQATEQIQQAQQEVAATAVETEQGTQETVKEPNVTEETQPDTDDDKGIEWLKREVIHAHKLLTEKEQELEQLQELFETVMAENERLHKENILLENQVQRLREANQELTERNDRYSDNCINLQRELKALRLYTLQKLQKDVYGA
ncbi:helix-turn-helix domain-containing protein [Anoxybacillus gonensis]|uniref:helix-turn-helix domain-containing protein n=1 Tax=Anoxybacillus gonensis TaxID=198467 RepID=UPI003D767016